MSFRCHLPSNSTYGPFRPLLSDGITFEPDFPLNGPFDIDSQTPGDSASTPRSCRADGGFTLLEAIVAFTIAALALAVLYRGAAEGLRATRTAGDVEQAIARARSHLAAQGVALAPGDQQGDDGGGFHWHVRTTPVGSFAPPAGQTGQPA